MTATGGGGGTDGVVDDASFADRVLTLTRTNGLADLTATLPNSVIVSQIASWARVNNPTGQIADVFIPATIARDSELPIVAAGTGISVVPTGTLPTTYTVTSTGGGGGSDGVVDDASFAGRVLTLTRSNGLANLTATLGTAAIDDRIVSWARVTNPTGTINDVFIPAGIARDTELPIVAAGTNVTVDQVGTTYTVNATGGGGGGGPTSVTAFECVLADLAAVTYAVFTNILECDGTPAINEGGFVVEDASGTDTSDRVVIQDAGFYALTTSVYIESIASATRTSAHVAFQLERAGTDAVFSDVGTEYVRDGVEVGSIEHTSLVELEVDDRIGLVLRSEVTAATLAIDGSKSVFAIVRVGGAEGPRGPPGTGSDIDSLDVAYSPDVRTWELTIGQTGGGATFSDSTTIPIATQSTFGLIEMANGPEVEAGSAINRAIGPSTISFLNPNQMASGNAASVPATCRPPTAPAGLRGKRLAAALAARSRRRRRYPVTGRPATR